MTCIVALKHDGAVWMGADSAGVGGYSLHLRKDPKIYRVGALLMGFTSSFRMGQLLGYKLKVPDHDPRMAAEKWMATEFIDACRTCFKEGGWMRKDHEVEEGGFFLVAYQGRIFHVQSDLQVAETLDDYAATGCGADLALGSFFTSEGREQDPAERVKTALRAAAYFSAGVNAPFLVEKL